MPPPGTAPRAAPLCFEPQQAQLRERATGSGTASPELRRVEEHIYAVRARLPFCHKISRQKESGWGAVSVWQGQGASVPQIEELWVGL